MSQTPGTIPMGDWDMIQDGCLAQVKQLEGAILRRYDKIPGSTVSLGVDGKDLVAEGRKDWSAWLEDLQLRTPEIPMQKSGNQAARLPSGN